MIEETIAELDNDIGKANEALKRELAKIRTGRARSIDLDSVRVEIYGSRCRSRNARPSTVSRSSHVDRQARGTRRSSRPSRRPS